MDTNSIKNQEIKRAFVQREVNVCLSTIVEYILSKSHEDRDAPFSFDDIENFYSYPEYIGKHANFEGGTEEQLQEEKDRLQTLIDECEVNQTAQEIEDELNDLENLESQAQEVFEWWSVSNWLCEKLRDIGEPVIMEENIWGRCTTGQAILLDYAITKICSDLEILEGQENEWKI